MDNAAHALTKIERLHNQTRSWEISLRMVEVSEHREKIDKLTVEVKAKHLELQTMSGLVATSAMPREECGKHLEVD